MTNPTITSSAVVAGFDQAAFDRFTADRDEPDWIASARRAAFADYQQKLRAPLDPEEWKRIDLRAFRPEQFGRKPPLTSPKDVNTLLEHRTEFAGLVSHVDGHCRRAELSPKYVRQGVLLGDLGRLAGEHRERIEPHLSALTRETHADRFSAWHAAFWTGGTLLYVPRNVLIEEPLYSLISLTQDDAFDFSHTLVILEEGAQATLLEETASAGDAPRGLHVGSVELHVGRGAKLRYVQLQNWNKNVWHFAHQEGYVEADGALQWTVGGLGARLAHIHQHVRLAGPGADAQVNGVTFATDRQLLSYYTQQTHHAPATHSDLLYKDVLRDRSRVVWRGMIKVDPGAQKADGYQRNDSLLLSADCRADAIPGLEIEADDVRCTHGATAGRVDEEQLFYCMCRGLTEYEAMHMIVEGFFQIVFDRIPVDVVRETLRAAVERKLGIGN
jgi:Fe-S cluster assembly protein SufD